MCISIINVLNIVTFVIANEETRISVDDEEANKNTGLTQNCDWHLEYAGDHSTPQFHQILHVGNHQPANSARSYLHRYAGMPAFD